MQLTWRVRLRRSGSREPSRYASRPSASIRRALPYGAPRRGSRSRVPPAAGYADAPAAALLIGSRGRRMVTAAQAPTLRSSFFFATRRTSGCCCISFETTAPPLTRKRFASPGWRGVRGRCARSVGVAAGPDKATASPLTLDQMGALLIPRSSVVELDRGMLALLELTLQARFELALRYAMTRYWSM